MTENDISIDLGVISGAVRKLSEKARVLEKLAAAMKHNLSVAAKDFSSANFERAAEVVGRMEKNISETVYKMEKVKNYLNNLEDCAEEYLYAKF